MIENPPSDSGQRTDPPGPQAKAVSPPMARRRHVLFALTGLLLASAFALAVAEVLLRVFNPISVRERTSWHFLLWEVVRVSHNRERVWEQVPNYDRKLVGYRVKKNSLGLRGEEISPEKPPGCRRLLALGDSMTFGMGAEQEDCYPAQLQVLLRKQYPNRRIEVINGGMLGYTTLQEEALLRELLPILRPDVVVLWWWQNDDLLTGSANPDPPEQQMLKLVGAKPHTTPRKLVHAAYEVAPCTMALIRTFTVGRGEGQQPSFAFDSNANPAGWAANSASLQKIADFCTSHSARLILYTFCRYDVIAEFCRKNQVPYVTTVERAGPEHLKQFAVTPWDMHFNRRGNAAVARTVLDAVAPLIR